MDAINPGDLWVVAPVEATYCLGANDAGAVAWTPNRPEPSGGTWHIYEPGGRDSIGAFQESSSGTGSLLVSTPIGSDGGHSPIVQLIVGTASSAGAIQNVNDLTNFANLFFSSTSGTHQYDILFRVVNVDAVATLKWTAELGYSDGNLGATTDGAAICVQDGAHANFQCCVTSNGTRTTTDSGVAIVAGTWYRGRVVITNATSVSFWIVADSLTNTNLGAATVTISSNIPTGTARATCAGINGFTNTTATTQAEIDYVFQRALAKPIRAVVASAAGIADNCLNPGDGLGLPLGYAGQEVNVSESGAMQWDERVPSIIACPLQAIDTALAPEYGNYLSSGTVTVPTTPVSGQPPLVQMSTSTSSSGASFRSWPDQTDTGGTIFDASSGLWVYETLIEVPTLSVTAQAFAVLVGFFGNAPTIAPTNTAMVILNSTVNAQFRCVTTANGTATSTTTGLTPIAGTFYYIRITVATNATVKYYIAALGSSWTSAVATHTTHIPTGTSETTQPGIGIIKSAGTTARTALYPFQNCYQRRTA